VPLNAILPMKNGGAIDLRGQRGKTTKTNKKRL